MTPLVLALLLSAEPPARMTAGQELPSLASAATLGNGGALFAASAGFPFLSAAYAQGLSPGLDAGGQLELDWVTTELFAGGTLRRAVLRHGDVDFAVRGRAGLYGNFGSTWWYEQNRGDVGLQLSPGAVVSFALLRGVASLSADLPFSFTTARGGGVVFGPRVGLTFETPLYGEWSAGARVGGLWHIATGGAPMADETRASAELSALVSYRLF